jgi:hypothetical protein
MLTIFRLNKQAKMQWLPNANQSNVGNLNNVRRKSNRYFRKKREYIIHKIDELETNSKAKNTRDFYIGVSMALRGVSCLELID